MAGQPYEPELLEDLARVFAAAAVEKLVREFSAAVESGQMPDQINPAEMPPRTA